jgi:hypothetical protein
MARERGTYDVLKLRDEQEIKKLIIEVHDDSDDDDDEDVNKTNRSKRKKDLSPVTMPSVLSLASGITAGDSSTTLSKSRKSSKQKSLERFEIRTAKMDNDSRYKAAFKIATHQVAAALAGTIPAEPVKYICDRLNVEYGLVSGKGKKLTRSTVYQAAKDGLAGQSPKKRDPAPKIPEVLMEAIATHVQVCQAGDGELKAKDIKRLIGASKSGTEYENRFQVDADRM